MTKREEISNIIYETLDYMYCDNCRCAFEIDENDEEWGCECCYRKYNGWGISRAVSDALADKIMRVGDTVERESIDYSAMNPWDRIFCDVNDICDTCARYGEDCDGRVIEGEDEKVISREDLLKFGAILP